MTTLPTEFRITKGKRHIATVHTADCSIEEAEAFAKFCMKAPAMFLIISDLALIDSGPDRPGEIQRLCDAARAIVVEVER